jgi:hypothetical protein
MAGSSPTVLHLDGADDQDFALAAAAAGTGERGVSGVADDLGLVDLRCTADG